MFCLKPEILGRYEQSYMVYRLPTPLESLVPPPSEQLQLSRPWRGTFVLNIANGAGNGASQEVRVTAAETDGEK